MAERHLELQPRLRALADWVRPGAALADVGTDHGYLPVWLLLQGRVRRAIASDLRPAPLDHARRTAAAFGAEEGLELRLCDGLTGLAPEEADTVVIAGMGGETIAAILEAAPWAADGAHTLLLQPMSRAERLRAWLPAHGCRVRRERLVEDKGVLYPILEAVGGEMDRPGVAELYGGFALQKDPLWGRYLSQRVEKLQRAAAGLSHARDPADRQGARALLRLARLLEEKGKEWECADRR